MSIYKGISLKNFWKLLQLTKHNTYFKFNGKIHKLKEELAMTASLALRCQYFSKLF